MKSIFFHYLLYPFLLAFPAFLYAQSTGKIEGVVTDKDDGSPLIGCQVMVEGTTLGNVTDVQGHYFVLSVPPGLRSVRFNQTGYTQA